MIEELLHIPVDFGDHVDIYSGVVRLSGTTWARVVHPETGPSDAAFLFVHPTSNFLGHYALEPLAGRGVSGVGFTTRYAGNDSALLVENTVLDIASAIKTLRDRGFGKVVLVGNSGGGGIAALYQSQAERPTITESPGGGGPDLTRADLPSADGLILLMAHPGRAQVYTEWLDPAVVDEEDPSLRDPSVDMFDARNGPPFSQDFLARYRAAQLARSDRIRSTVRKRLAELAASGGSRSDFAFVVHGTCADPRFLDLTIDPSDRPTGTLWGDAWSANFSPATLGRYSSGRSWLSQWSIADSHGDGPRHLAHVSVPVQVVYGTADCAAFPSHARALFDAVPHSDKQLVAIPGASHYFVGQPEKVGSAIDHMLAWARDHGLLTPRDVASRTGLHA